MRRRPALISFYLAFFAYTPAISYAQIDSTAPKCFNMTQVIPCGNQDFPRQAGDSSKPESADRYKIIDNIAIVLDQHTHLYWQQCTFSNNKSAIPCPSAELKTWDEADQACRALQLDHRQWRLPTVLELNSLLQLQQPGTKIATRYFTDTYPAPYWTQSEALTNHISDQAPAHENAEAWYVEFNSGNIFSAKKSTPMYVRCLSEANQ